jgi:hypothetical protein
MVRSEPRSVGGSQDQVAVLTDRPRNRGRGWPGVIAIAHVVSLTTPISMRPWGINHNLVNAWILAPAPRPGRRMDR